jgi:hypothetical protein
MKNAFGGDFGAFLVEKWVFLMLFWLKMRVFVAFLVENACF